MVRLGSSTSSPFVTPSGVPQGSHLGPILFLMFINDVSLCLSKHDVRFLLFCDDIKIFREIRSSSDHLVLQNALVELTSWFDQNLLEVNPVKCNIITFTRRKSPHMFDYYLKSSNIPRSSCVRDLGVLFDSIISFNPHFDNICSKASKMLGFITRSTKDFPDTLSFKVLYCSLVRSVLEFSSCVWNPAYFLHSGRIEKIQHQALRTLRYRMRSPHLSYSDLEKHFDLLPLSTRREMYDCITFFNILHSKLDCPDLVSSVNINIPTYSTRSHLPFRPPFVSTKYLQNSPMIRFQRTANSLVNIDFFSTTINNLKAHFST